MSNFIYIPEDGSGSGVNGYIFASLPTITDDITKGFDINDLAMYDGSVYVCIDNTTGAAIWKNLTALTIIDNTITFDSEVVFAGGVAFNAPATVNIDGNYPNLSVPDLDSKNVLLLNVGGTSNIRGLVRPTNDVAQTLIITNIGNGGFLGLGANVTLRDNDGSASAQNRFLFGSNILLNPNESCIIYYDPNAQRWRRAAETT